jgi:pimeloyl-ACP methyl ester carboxylesterase
MRFEVDGRAAYAYTGGKAFVASQPTIALVHGALHDNSVWALQSRYLAHHGWSVLAFDLPGHGRSAGPLLPDVESMAGWVLRAIGAAQAQAAGPAGPVVLAGHSLGALIALEAAGQAPDVPAGLCLVSVAFPMKVSDQLLDAARTDEAAAIDMINLWSHSRLNHRPGAPGPGFSVFVQNRRVMERQPRGTTLHDFNACNVYARGLERAEALRSPVLVVQGSRDVMVPPRSARDLLQRMPQARVVEIAGAGHAVMTEEPDALLDALKDWLAGLQLEPAAGVTAAGAAADALGATQPSPAAAPSRRGRARQG